MAAVVAVMSLGGAGACSGPSPPPFVVDLAGQHRMLVGDDPGFAALDLDDAGWPEVTVPGAWRVRSAALPAVRWYRLRFTWPAGVSADGMAVWLGLVGWADQTYLNGVEIGSTSRVDAVPDVNYRLRLYHLPPELVRPGGNVLAIRSRGGPLGASGLLSDRIGIGPELELTRARHRDLSQAAAIECVLLGFALFAWLLLAFLPKRGVTGQATLLLWVVVTMQIVHLGLGSVTAQLIGLSFEGTTRLRFLFLSIGGASLWAFVATIARGRLPRPVMVFCGAVCAMGVVGLFLPELGLPVIALSVLGASADIASLIVLALAVRARTPGAVPALIGYAGAFGLIWSTVVTDRPFLAGVAGYYYGIGWLAIGGLIALARQVDVVRRRAQRDSDYALAAHASERTRLARDLHDGLGQMLALLKMQLQRTAGRVADDGARGAIEEGVVQVDETLEELRRMARDLRPTPLEERSFGEAVRDYAAAVARRGGMEVVVTGELDEPLPERVAGELYRIVQECLTNCLKHSRAARIDVSLAGAADGYTLVVTDDGCGLSDEAGTSGMGLHTIRERSELLGGSCALTRPDGGGTRVEVRIPRAVLPA